MLKHNPDDWEFICDIGEGQYGRVIKCRKKNGFILNDQVDYVAIKIISKNKFKKNETDILENIRLFNIPRYYSHGEDEEFIYIYMECIDGENVANILRRKGKFKEKRIVSMVAVLTETLSFLHKHHVIHRDIKTANLVLDRNKNLKLIDFGASTIQRKKEFEQYLNDSGSSINLSIGEKQSSFSIVGTLLYMAPEVKRNYRATRKSDSWSLGCTIVEMAGGDLTKRSESGVPIIPDHVSPTLKDFINHCLVTDPKKRSYMEELLNHKLISSIIGPNKSNSYSKLIPKLNEDDEDEDDDNTNIKNNHVDNSSSRFPVKFEAQYLKPAWEIEYEDLEFNNDESIKGAGNFGDVRKGYLNETEVAIKFVRKAHCDAVTVCDTFYHEVLILSNLRHPNIVQFMAACIKYGEKETFHCIVSEWMSGGNIRQFVTNHHRVLDENPHLRVKFSLDIAKGMLYLHKQHPPIIHRDLTSNNVLLDFKREIISGQTYISNEFTAKVCDFGLSSSQSESKKMRGGSIHYLAPENLRNESPINEKSDVYAFSLIVWELFSYAPPNTIYSPKEMASMVANSNYRPPMPYNVPVKFREIITQCWDSNPLNRPTFTTIIEKLKDIALSFTNKSASSSPILRSPITFINNNGSNHSSNDSGSGLFLNIPVTTTGHYYSKTFGDSNNSENSENNIDIYHSIDSLKPPPEIHSANPPIQEDWEIKLKKLDLEHEIKSSISVSANNNNDDDDNNNLPHLPNDLGYC